MRGDGVRTVLALGAAVVAVAMFLAFFFVWVIAPVVAIGVVCVVLFVAHRRVLARDGRSRDPRALLLEREAAARRKAIRTTGR